MAQASWIPLTFELVLAAALALTALACLASAWRAGSGNRKRRRLALVELAWSSFPLAFLLALAAVALVRNHA